MILNGQRANQTNFNAAFASRTVAQTIAGGKEFQDYIAVNKQDIATTASITAMVSAKSFTKFTGSTATALHGITASVNGFYMILYNGSSASVTLKSESGSASAANRLSIGGVDFILFAGQGVALSYDLSATRWVLASQAVPAITALTGDVTATGPGSSAATIANDAVTNAKLANMATARFKGRTTAGTGDPEDLTGTQATAMLDVMVGDSGSGGTKGLVPAPGVGDATKAFKGDGTFGNAINALTGDVTASGNGSVAATIANDAITNAKSANMATQTIKGRTTAGTGDPEDLTATQATAILNSFVGDSGSGGTKGLAPAPAAGDAAAGKFLKADGTYAVPPGSGSTPIVVSGYNQTVTGTITGTDSVAVFTSPNIDNTSSYNTGTGTFTSTKTSRFNISSSVAVIGTFIAADYTQIGVYVNGALLSAGIVNVSGATSATYADVNDFIVDLTIGDTIQIKVSASGTSPVYATGGNKIFNKISIQEVI